MFELKRPRSGGEWAVALLGFLFLLIGLVLAAGGLYLISLGGSWYYLPAGLGLVASGILLIGANVAGIWLYSIVFALTAIWSFWEAGLNGWALLPRLTGPFVLFVLAMLAFGALSRTNGRRRILNGLTVSVAFAVVVGGAVWMSVGSRDAAVSFVAATEASLDPAPEKTGTDWPEWAGTRSGMHFSPVTSINKENVADLKQAWVYRSGLVLKKYAQETTPLKVGHRIYLCTGKNELVALNAADGKEIWKYDPGVDPKYTGYTNSCRGVVYYKNPDAAPGQACAARIIEGTLDMRLVAADAETGQACEDFGNRGSVDLKAGLMDGEFVPTWATITSAPIVVRGVIVTGQRVTDNQVTAAPSGVIRGVDAITGELRFAWDLGSPETTTTPANGKHYTLGTPNSWAPVSGDDALGLVYLPMGNAGGDLYSTQRTGEMNEYSSSVVALDVATGKPRWHFQTVRKDVWDYDLGTQPTLIDLKTNKGTVPSMVLSSKQGDIYVLDRRDGTPVFPVEDLPVPQGGVEPEQRSPTQPYSGFANLRTANLDETQMWGMSPIDQLYCRIQYRQASYEGMYTPPTADKPWIQFPGYNGGSDWGGISIDPTRNLLIANYSNTANYNNFLPRAVAEQRGVFPANDPRRGKGPLAEGPGPAIGTPYAVEVNAGWRVPFTKMLCTQPPYGGIRAVDLSTGKTVWDKPFGSAERNGPFGVPTLLPLDIGTPNNGGAVMTASGLTFIAATTDNYLRAYDSETGKVLWKTELPAGGQANPMIYEERGKAYLVIFAGGHHFMETPPGDYFIAYALPDK
ncbi:membrane-bound PQQ-dependent dehydrogenase, glucose/quinate/shikimate family [Rhizobium panacihumi]|uniref:membrane-bound PQQ-dependent dehydrogenase, glucose/quinate/shikimate family n=1 Tax=Rhizobium panacihumi TaxID=2008450 RepID=UPI003D7944CE